MAGKDELGDCRFRVGSVRGGEFAQAGYGGGDDGEGVVYLLGGGEAREGEANAGAGAGRREAHGGEDMGWLGGAGLAGGASADGEAFEVECDDQSFGFEVIEIDAGGVGDARGSRSVDAALFDLGEDALFETVAEGSEMGRGADGGGFDVGIWSLIRGGGEPGVGEFCRFTEADYTCDVFGSGTALAFV